MEVRATPRFTLAVASSALCLAACLTPTGPDPLPSAEFGTVTAVVDGTAWISSVANHSLVAFYDASLDRLVIQGQRVQPGHWPGLRITLSGPRGPGRYALGDRRHAGEWVTTNKYRQLAAYVTTGVATDEVILDELDLQSGHVRGSFQITPQLLHGTSSVSIRGQFWGRVSGAPSAPPPIS